MELSQIDGFKTHNKPLHTHELSKIDRQDADETGHRKIKGRMVANDGSR